MGAGSKSVTRGWLAALATSAIALGHSARAGTPLDELIEPAEGKRACFARVYDDAHLKRNPRQTTKAITVWLKYGSLPGGASGIALDFGLGINRRGDPTPLFQQGSCKWDEGANINTSNQPLIKQYKAQAGAVCIMFAQPDVFEASSAEEGGFLIFNRGRDRDTLMLYLDDGLTMVTRADRGRHLSIDFGPADRVFPLRRTDPKNCTAVEEAVTEPESGARQR